MFETIHKKIFRYVDQKTCYEGFTDYDRWIQKQYLGSSWLHIYMSDKDNVNDRLKITKDDKGMFRPRRMILIHRQNKSKPDLSFADEITTVLHEYGHYVSFHKGNIDDDVQTTEVGSSYLIHKSLQKSLVYDEEYNAWKHAFFTVWHLPAPKTFRICLYPYMAAKAIIALHSYRMFVEGIVG